MYIQYVPVRGKLTSIQNSRGLDTVKQIALDYSRYALNTSNSQRSVGVADCSHRQHSPHRGTSLDKNPGLGADRWSGVLSGARAGISSYIETVRCLRYNRAAIVCIEGLVLLFIVVVGNI